MKECTKKRLEKAEDQLKYWKIQRRKVNKKIAYNIAIIRRITKKKGQKGGGLASVKACKESKLAKGNDFCSPSCKPNANHTEQG